MFVEYGAVVSTYGVHRRRPQTDDEATRTEHKNQFVTSGSVQSKLNSYINSACFDLTMNEYPVIGADGKQWHWRGGGTQLEQLGYGSSFTGRWCGRQRFLHPRFHGA